MAERKKVIRGLECHATKGFVACQDCPYYPDELIYEDDDDMEGIICEEKLAADALALLKEREAKPPIINENSYGWKFYYCPSCKKEFYQNHKFRFCEKCGQEVKWDE